MSREVEPLGCPFCGRAPIVIERGGRAGVRCTCGGASFVHTYGAYSADAIAAWNRRATDQAGRAAATWAKLDDNGLAELRVNGQRITSLPSYGAAQECADRINAALASTPVPVGWVETDEALDAVARDICAERSAASGDPPRYTFCGLDWDGGKCDDQRDGPNCATLAKIAVDTMLSSAPPYISVAAEPLPVVSPADREPAEEWLRAGSLLYTLEQDGWIKGKPAMRNRLMVRVDAHHSVPFETVEAFVGRLLRLLTERQAA